MDVQLVTRAGCHLCNEALTSLRELGLEPRLQDVDADEDLFRLYDFRVPVVLLDGREVGEGRLDRASLARALGLPDLSVRPCHEEAAAEVHALTQAAFREYTRLDPPSGVVRESKETVRADLAGHGGALVHTGATPIGCLRLVHEPGALQVRRVAVHPAWRGRGAGTALMRWAEAEARRRRLAEMAVGVRLELQQNLAFYTGLGYQVESQHRHPGYDHPTWVRMSKRLG